MTGVSCGSVYEADTMFSGRGSLRMMNSRAEAAQSTTPPIWEATVSVDPVVDVSAEVLAAAVEGR